MSTAQTLAQGCLDEYYGEGRVTTSGVQDFEHGWIFFVCNAEDGSAFFGNAPVIVDRADGLIYRLGTAQSTEYYLSEYRRFKDNLVRVRSFAQGIKNVLERVDHNFGLVVARAMGQSPRLFRVVNIDGQGKVFDDATDREMAEGALDPRFDELWFDWDYRLRDPLGYHKEFDLFNDND